MTKINVFLSKNKPFFPYAFQAIENGKGCKDFKLRRISQLKCAEKSSVISTFSDVNKKKIVELNEKLLEKDYKRNYITTVHAAMRFCIKSAIKDGFLSKHPYKGLELEKAKKINTERYISTDSYLKVLHAKIDDDRLNYVRDLFVFQCNTGLSYSDLMSSVYSEISILNGSSWIFGSRNKTGVSYYVPLSSIAIQIIEKYRGVTKIVERARKDNEHLFVHIDTCNYNLLLKEVGRLAGLKEILTTHRGRHTFATMMLENGVSIEAISKMLGHSRPIMTELYSKVTVNKIMKEISKQSFFNFISI